MFKLIKITILSVFISGCAYNNEMIIEVTYDPALGTDGFNGRLLVMITKDTVTEPRFQINDSDQTGIIIGKEVQNWSPATPEFFSKNTLAYPIEKFGDLKEGDYFAQALLHKYETFQLASGHTVQLPMDQGEGQHWNISPKNIYSKPIEISIGKKNDRIQIFLTEEIPSIAAVKDSEYIKHIKIKSDLLTKFWGRPMYLQGNVLLPKGFSKNNTTRYPLMIFHGHFPKP